MIKIKFLRIIIDTNRMNVLLSRCAVFVFSAYFIANVTLNRHSYSHRLVADCSQLKWCIKTNKPFLSWYALRCYCCCLYCCCCCCRHCRRCLLLLMMWLIHWLPSLFQSLFNNFTGFILKIHFAWRNLEKLFLEKAIRFNSFYSDFKQ